MVGWTHNRSPAFGRNVGKSFLAKILLTPRERCNQNRRLARIVHTLLVLRVKTGLASPVTLEYSAKSLSLKTRVIEAC